MDEGAELRDLSPMLLTKVASPIADPAYVYELKYDGYRVLVEANGAASMVQYRRGSQQARRFPEIVAILAQLPPGRHVLDGELCILDQFGRPDFTRFKKRAARCSPGDDPAVLVVFDLLVESGRGVMHLDLIERKRRLARLCPPTPAGLLLAQHLPGEQGLSFYAQACALKLEGIVGKKKNSVYRPGERSADWIKIKRPGVHQGWGREEYDN